LLLISTTGIAISKHYCGNTLRIISINNEVTACCSEEEMPGCTCNSETAHYKIDSDFQPAQFDLDTFQSILLFSANFLVNHFLIEGEQINLVSAYNSPPLSEPSSIIIKVQSFLL
jgi:hypothetical protein